MHVHKPRRKVRMHNIACTCVRRCAFASIHVYATVLRGVGRSVDSHKPACTVTVHTWVSGRVCARTCARTRACASICVAARTRTRTRTRDFCSCAGMREFLRVHTCGCIHALRASEHLRIRMRPCVHFVFIGVNIVPWSSCSSRSRRRAWSYYRGSQSEIRKGVKEEANEDPSFQLCQDFHGGHNRKVYSLPRCLLLPQAQAPTVPGRLPRRLPSPRISHHDPLQAPPPPPTRPSPHSSHHSAIARLRTVLDRLERISEKNCDQMQVGRGNVPKPGRKHTTAQKQRQSR